MTVSNVCSTPWTCLDYLRTARSHVVNARKGRCYVDESKKQISSHHSGVLTLHSFTLAERQNVMLLHLNVWSLHHSFVQCAPSDIDMTRAACLSEQVPIAVTEQDRHGRLAAALHSSRALTWSVKTWAGLAGDTRVPTGLPVHPRVHVHVGARRSRGRPAHGLR